MRRRNRHQLLAAAALVVAAGVGTLAAPFAHPDTAGGQDAPTTTGSASAADVTDALRNLHALPVFDGFVPGYDRALFGQAWADTDHNGCDTRNDVLRRDLTDVVTKPGTHGCVVLSGTLHDSYTGRTITFRRGHTTSRDVQIDHRIPLAYAWQHGASTWTAERRRLFANDQTTNLVAVDGHANEAKSDSGPAGWAPPNTGDACDYAASFVAVATTWQLSITTADQRALTHTLTACN
jgi:hypothetical protein